MNTVTDDISGNSASALTNNHAQRRLEMRVGEHGVFADYRLDGSVLVIPHVEAAPALRGTGAAGIFMEALMNYAHDHHLTIRPLCGYAATWMQRHREYQDILD